MEKKVTQPEKPHYVQGADELMSPRGRRAFVRNLLAGGTVVMLPAVFASCDRRRRGITDPDPDPPGPVTGVSFDLRSDIGIFRFAHALEQLEAAFYTAVVGSAAFASFTAEEREVLTDIRDTEIIHREFIATALGDQRVPNLTGSINTTTLNTILSSKANIFNTARAFETIGVAALNGAGKYLQDVRNLLLAGKLVSVEARHAAALRDLAPPAGVNPVTAFAGDDITDANGLDVKLEAGAVLQRVIATNLLLAGTLAAQPFTNAPTPAQGQPTPDFFPANP